MKFFIKRSKGPLDRYPVEGAKEEIINWKRTDMLGNIHAEVAYEHVIDIADLDGLIEFAKQHPEGELIIATGRYFLDIPSILIYDDMIE